LLLVTLNYHKGVNTYPDYHTVQHDAKRLLQNLMSDESMLDLCQSSNQPLVHQHIDLQRIITYKCTCYLYSWVQQLSWKCYFDNFL